MNPSGNLWLPEDDLFDAIAAGLETWEEWNPNVSFKFMGVTDRQPLPRDGLNVIGFLPFEGGWAVTFPTYGPAHGEEDPYIVEMDVAFKMPEQWVWRPCHQMEGSCPSRGPIYERPPGPGGDPMPVPEWVTVSVHEIQSVMTHEAGHVLGLNHPDAEADGVLTMAALVNGSRHQTTLGLGDVLGARALYPWTCPAPGQPIPYRYERVCPSIRIFAP